MISECIESSIETLQGVPEVIPTFYPSGHFQPSDFACRLNNPM